MTSSESVANERLGITISDLRFHYDASGAGRSDRFSLHLPRFEVSPGERVAIIGPSGCGKTTLLGLLTGILIPQTGQVVVSGTEISGLVDAERRRFRIARMGLVFQSLALVEYLDVLDNILHSYRITNALRLDEAVRNRARSLASELGLEGKLRRPVGALSQGERQRVAIGRALLSNPEVLLADEATGNLDPINKGRIVDLLFSQLDRHRSTLVAVTHDHELLPRFDRVLDFRELRES
jgi:putative ABC transport system ATP-binding protein